MISILEFAINCVSKVHPVLNLQLRLYRLLLRPPREKSVVGLSDGGGGSPINLGTHYSGQSIGEWMVLMRGGD
ncbi:hypothetical protein AN958_08244 [Leucoagaricus sp. SymC.cos]|nr:hypothetical protein AN958_08244 [Leucoagaricus sp. SymC.cos]